MNNGKSPGSDGITTEFYKIFWKDIKTYLINSLNYSFQQSQLTEIQTQSIITLLPKHGKDPTFLENWRPISLLNIDYKIASKSIANRLKNVLESIISPSQTGFIKGRYIGENIRLLCQMLEHVDDNHLSSIIFFADFEKAFDSVDHEFMFKTFKHFNFGDSFLKWLKLFYKDAQSSVTNNGHLTDFFPIQRGVRQGCPLSPYVFITCIELLSNCISKNNNIKGIKMSETEVKQTLFADDGTFITDGSKTSFENLIHTLDNFAKISGLKLNTKKCNILRTGLPQKNNITYMPEKNFTWNTDSAKTLGINFRATTRGMLKDNLEPKILEFTNCLKSWQHRKLSLLGKIAVIKTFALPKLIYPLTVLPKPSDQTINLIKSKMYEFIWNKKPDKIKRKLLTHSYEEGGLKMIDIDKFIHALKASWIKRIFDENNKGIWKEKYLDQIDKYGGKLLFQCNLSNKDIKQMFAKDLFLQELINAWHGIYRNENKTVRSQIIWNNKEIRVGENTIFYENWYNRGLQYLEQIYDFRVGRFFNFQTFQEIYDIPANDFLKYNQLLSSIPKIWKNSIKNERRPSKL